MKRTLVIGNGFDLDAGMKTSYSDFPSLQLAAVNSLRIS